MLSRVNRARGTISPLPTNASRMVPSDRPSRLVGTSKLLICRMASTTACAAVDGHADSQEEPKLVEATVQNIAVHLPNEKDSE